MTDKERIEEYKILRKTGRLVNGNEGGAGFIYHAVKGSYALCGTIHGRLGNWSVEEGEKVTCPKCLKKLEQIKLQNQKAVEALEKVEKKICNIDWDKLTYRDIALLDDFVNRLIKELGGEE